MAGLVPAIHVLGLHVRCKNVDAIGKRSDAVLRTAIGERSDAVLRTAIGKRSDAVLRTAIGKRSDAVLRTAMDKPGHDAEIRVGLSEPQTFTSTFGLAIV